MPELSTYGSARGVPGNGHPYRKPSRERLPCPGTRLRVSLYVSALVGMLVHTTSNKPRPTWREPGVHAWLRRRLDVHTGV
jgi:hypothetical protein